MSNRPPGRLCRFLTDESVPGHLRCGIRADMPLRRRIHAAEAGCEPDPAKMPCPRDRADVAIRQRGPPIGTASGPPRYGLAGLALSPTETSRWRRLVPADISTSADHSRCVHATGGLVSRRFRGRNDRWYIGHAWLVFGGSPGTVSASDTSRPPIRPDRGPSGEPRRSRNTAARHRAAKVELQRLAHHLTHQQLFRGPKAQITGVSTPMH